MIVSFIDTMAQLPILAPFTRSIGAGATYTGIILGSYSLVNMVGNVFAGPVIDRRGRKATILFGLSVAGLAVAGYALTSRPWHLLALRVVHGVGGAVLIPAVFAWAGDRAVRHKKTPVGRSMGYAGAAVAVAATIGPALGGIGSAIVGTRTVFLLIGVLLCATAVVVATVAETPPYVPLRRPVIGDSPIAGIRASIRTPALRYAYFSVFGLTFAMGTLAYTFPLTMESRGFSAASTGIFFSIFSLATISLLLLPTNRVLDRWKRSTVVTTGSILVMVALALLSVSAGFYLLGITMIVYGLGFGLVFPATCAMVVDTTEPDRRGTAFGVYYAVYSLGVFIGPIVAGFLSGRSITPYWAAVLLLVVLRFVCRYDQSREINTQTR